MLDVVITLAHIALLIAIYGAVLSTINLGMDWWRNRIRLRVMPKLYALSREGPGTFEWARSDPDWERTLNLQGKIQLCVDVKNIGNKAVTVTEVGFARKRRAHRSVIMRPMVLPEGPWPRRLEPHSAVTVYSSMTPETLWKRFGRVRYGFAETASGRVFKGSSPIFEQLKKRLG